MKFQNPSFKFVLKGWTDKQTDGQTNGRTSRKQYSPHFFKVGGIIKGLKLLKGILKSVTFKFNDSLALLSTFSLPINVYMARNPAINN